MNTCEEEKDGRMLLHITSFVDPENPLQHQRLFEQDLIMTAGMGGPLIEQSGENLDEIYDVLDLACGPGGWVLDVARAYPEMMVQGIDSSPFMIRYAQGSAARQGLTNVRFQVMDVTRSFAFPDASFDLINAHLISSLLYPDQWPFLLVECMRLLRPGGIIRLTEGEWGLVTRCAPTVARLSAIFLTYPQMYDMMNWKNHW